MLFLLLYVNIITMVFSDVIIIIIGFTVKIGYCMCNFYIVLYKFNRHIVYIFICLLLYKGKYAKCKRVPANSISTAALRAGKHAGRKGVRTRRAEQ